MPQAAGRLPVLLLLAGMVGCTGSAPPVVALSYPIKQTTYTQGNPIAPLVPTLLGLPGASFSAFPPLPAGLELNPSTGVIHGTPRAVSPTTDYIVTARNGASSLIAPLTLAVKTSRYQFGYYDSPAVYTFRQQINPNVPVGDVPAGATFTITPALPDGLVLDTATGAISGRPVVAAPVEDYRISATNAEGTKSAHLSLTVRVGQSCAGVPLLGGAPMLDAHLKPGATAVADLNGDGNPDIVVGSDTQDTVNVVLSRGDGAFTPPVSYTVGSADLDTGPSPVLLSDLNSDGHPDLVAAGLLNDELCVRLNKGDGTFGDQIMFSPHVTPNALAVGDLNRDGYPDLVIASDLRDSRVTVRPGRGDGTFGEPLRYNAGRGADFITLVDLDGDGALDLVTKGAGRLSFLLNDGGGDLGEEQELLADQQIEALAIGDLTGDGLPDIAVATWPPGNRVVHVFQSLGGGTFAPFVEPALTGVPDALAIADVDGDGRADLVASFADMGEVGVWFNEGSGNLAARADSPVPGHLHIVAVTDINKDGRADLVVSGDEVGILVSEGNGSFLTRHNAPIPLGVGTGAVVDLNGDGLPEVVVTESLSAMDVLSNLGNGRFGSPDAYATGYMPRAVAAGDLNKDGFPDLVTANTDAATLSVLLNRGDSTFAPKVDFPAGISPNFIAMGDLDGDGVADVVTSEVESESITVVRGDGQGGLATTRTGYDLAASVTAIAIGDLDNDGAPDVAVAGWAVRGLKDAPIEDTVSVLLNRGDGTLQAPTYYPTGDRPVSLAVADLNGDGWLDLVLGNRLGRSVSILLNRGDGTFAPRVDYNVDDDPSSIALGDLTGDGLPEVVVSRPSLSSVNVLLNRGDGSFAPAVAYSTDAEPSFVAVSDVDGDGRLDVVSVNESGSVSVLPNDGCVR